MPLICNGGLSRGGVSHSWHELPCALIISSLLSVLSADELGVSSFLPSFTPSLILPCFIFSLCPSFRLLLHHEIFQSLLSVWQHYHPCHVCPLSLISVVFQPTHQLRIPADEIETRLRVCECILAVRFYFLGHPQFIICIIWYTLRSVSTGCVQCEIIPVLLKNIVSKCVVSWKKEALLWDNLNRKML